MSVQRFRPSPGRFDPFTSAKGETGEKVNKHPDFGKKKTEVLVGNLC